MIKKSIIIFLSMIFAGAFVSPSAHAVSQVSNFPKAKCSSPAAHLMPSTYVNLWDLGEYSTKKTIKELRGLKVQDKKTKVLMDELISSVRTGSVEMWLVDEIVSRMRRGYC